MKLSVCIPALLLVSASLALAQTRQPARIAPPSQTHASDVTLAPPLYAEVTASPISELSGMVKSRRRDNLYWVHNDSGDSARIFAIDAQGHNVLPTYSRFSYYGEEPEPGKAQWQGFEVLYADNVDWEDIAVDENYLYLADTGNNRNVRRDLAIYMVSEIDPTASTRTAVIRKLPVAYPEQQGFPSGNERHYDSEAMFVDNGQVYLITKYRDGWRFRDGLFDLMKPGASLYRLDTRFTDQVNQLALVDSHATLTAATGAELSPDGKTLAVISSSDLWLFARPDQGDKWFSAASRRYPLDREVFDQVEAITWDDNDSLVISNEQGEIFHVDVPLSDIR